MPTCAMPRVIYLQLSYVLVSRELASAEDEVPLWDGSSHIERSAQRCSPLLRSVMRPQNDGIGLNSSPALIPLNISQTHLQRS
jgi:hypothetical protein